MATIDPMTLTDPDEILDNYTGADRARTIAALVRRGVKRAEAECLLRELDDDIADGFAELKAMRM